MPTAESAAYLAKKPTVPPTFQDVDFSNNEALVNARDAVVREQWVKIMMARLVREEMGKCYVREGNNHLEKCGRYRGTLFNPILMIPLARIHTWKPFNQSKQSTAL